MKFKCPKCQALVYSRALGICAACKAPLPAAFLLSEAEKQELDRETQRAKDRAENLKTKYAEPEDMP